MSKPNPPRNLAVLSFATLTALLGACASADSDDGAGADGPDEAAGGSLSGATDGNGGEGGPADPNGLGGASGGAAAPDQPPAGGVPAEPPPPADGEGAEDVEAGDLDAAALADVQLKRDLIDRAVVLGKTALADELNLGLERDALAARYQSSLARGVDYEPPAPQVTCPFLVTPNEAADRATDCRSLTDRAKVAGYGQITAIMARNPLDARYDADKDGNTFWFEQGLMTGISNEAELALRHLRDAGECDQALEPARSAFEEGVDSGRRAYVRRLNERLAETGHPMNYPDGVTTMEVCSVDTSFLAPARTRALADLDGLTETEPVCGPDYAPASADELARLTDARTQYRRGMERGVTTEDGLAAERLFRVVPCNVGDPLVLDLDGGGVTLIPAVRGPVFDLFGWGEGVRTSWIGAGEAFLALDKNGNGRIDNGRELFVNFVGDVGYQELPSGFDHLATYDENRDGVVDARDPVFAKLRLWRDADGDATSDPGELTPLAAAGVTSLAVRYSAGSTLPLPHAATFGQRDGRTGQIRDAFFTIGRAAP